MLGRRHRSPQSNDLVPGYTGLVPIGTGRCGTVYGGLESSTGRPVALKVLNIVELPDLTELLEAFSEDLHVLGRVADHPNIVTFFGSVSTGDGRPVLVLELCRESLAEIVQRDGPLPPLRATRIAIKIAGALEVAHQNGLLHQVLKPQNVLLTQFGEPALSDLGIGVFQPRLLAAAGLSDFASVHAAPEILEGRNASPATDIYGLASTIYELVSGRAAFSAYDNETPASVILRILRDPPPQMNLEEVPFALAEQIHAAMAKDPAQRPATAAEFADLLRAVEKSEGWPATTFTGLSQLAYGALTPRRQTQVADAGPPMGSQGSVTQMPATADLSTRGVAAPAAGLRNVLLPEGSRRGPMGPPLPVSAEPLPPLEESSVPDALHAPPGPSVRPTFADPLEGTSESSADSADVLARRPSPRPPVVDFPAEMDESRFRDHGHRLTVPALAAAGAVAAATVIVAALLVIVGVL